MISVQIGAHFDGQRLLSEIAEARERDHSDLIIHLKSLAENDHKILEALQADGYERRRLQELVIALTKVNSVPCQGPRSGSRF
jgi:hypothetical protein